MILYQPTQVRDGKRYETPMWHKKALHNGFLYVSGCDPEQLIDLGYVMTNDAGLDEAGRYVGRDYKVVEVLERRDHRGMPAGNNAFFKVKCEVLNG